MKKYFFVLLVGLFVCTLTTCQSQDTPVPSPTDQSPTLASTEINPTVSPTPTLEPPRVLTICSQEPTSLFLYMDTSSAARSVLQAIYDGPYDVVNYTLSPVILESIPSLENGDLYLEPVEVFPGELIIDAQGNWVTFAEGINYRPSGCLESNCALTYAGLDPVQMDSMVAIFRLLPGVQWSDGQDLTASDSVFSFQVFEAMFDKTPPDILQVTQDYVALDEGTVQWSGIPGYLGTTGNHFFSPLPTHKWDGFDLDFLLSSEAFTRQPIGWGPYVIDEWIAGDHITLSRNLNYFRSAEGLPHFDYLVYRFMENGDEAIDALLVGECDLVDRSLLFEQHIPRLQTEQGTGTISLMFQAGNAWELTAFGINSFRPESIALFTQAAVRQAVAMCIDRQRIVEELLFGAAQIQHSYVPPNHPLSNPDVKRYEYDPEAASALLDSAGWIDQDGDPQTPRTSNGVTGVPNGTPLSFTYLVPAGGQRLQVAEMIRQGLTSCGIEAEIVVGEWDELMQPGPDGPLFGRQFELAQFAWETALEPSCILFTTDEIPGPYPEFPKGWGGSNLSGYSNPEFDEACMQGRFLLPGSELYLQSHQRAQAIFTEQLPVIPLYQRFRLIVARPDLCNFVLDPSANSALTHLELLDFGPTCSSE